MSTTNNISHSGVKGMKWGIRRYQNPDGSLTALGKKRYNSAVNDAPTENQQKAYNAVRKRHLDKNPGDEAGANAAADAAFKNMILKDAVKEDLDSTNTILRETSNASQTARTAINKYQVKAPRMDLSNMSDAEMRARIQRERLESEYDSLFNSRRREAEAGKQAVANVLEGIGAVASIGASALGIALAIKKLKGD